MIRPASITTMRSAASRAKRISWLTTTIVMCSRASSRMTSSTSPTISTSSALVGSSNSMTFARATTEPPGVGAVGQAFIDSLRSQVGGRSVGVYAVNYPATEDFAQSASAGANDAQAHVQSVAANCPNTQMVLGGYSQGALVIDLITAVPVSMAGFTPAPMPPDVADHVAAVAVFGNPMGRSVGASLNAVSPVYGAKAIDLCMPGDAVCSPGGGMSAPSRDEMFSGPHVSYVESGMASQGAAFAAGRL
jgi:cutinase